MTQFKIEGQFLIKSTCEKIYGFIYIGLHFMGFFASRKKNSGKFGFVLLASIWSVFLHAVRKACECVWLIESS